ncbi:hypothetical protein MTR67_026859 [Solanum verrucosum]|uniref:Uncharacterized protein n=1 Tax=Solanum verrucosum TaxID=315347 RepID=A0AAF0TV75_SOLVR|nr:hypothetical protein MTR67_026859 [Solanum verrucosum]
MSVLYHPENANVVIDALSRLSLGSVARVEDDKKKLVRNIHRLARLGVLLVEYIEGGVVVHKGSKLYFVLDVKAKQYHEPILIHLKMLVSEKVTEAHSFWYYIHPRATNMYRDL